MIVVFFICFFAIIALIIAILLLSVLKIDIEKLVINNINHKIKFNLESNIQIWLLNRLKILNIKITDETLKKLNINEKMKQLDIKKIESTMLSPKETITLIKKLNIKLGKIDLKIALGTVNVILTSMLTVIISTILSFILAKTVKEYKKSKYYYNIQPNYNGKNIVNLDLNCIIEFKIVHIIYIIYILIKRKRVDKNERASNRRTYDYSYE